MNKHRPLGRNGSHYAPTSLPVDGSRPALKGGLFTTISMRTHVRESDSGMRPWKPAWPVLLICLTPTLLTLATPAPAQSPAEAPTTEAGALTLEPCHIPRFRQEVQCGSLRVFENRSTRQGREIDIHVAVIAAVDGSSDLDPVVFFAGGPGQSAIEAAGFVRSVFSGVVEERDLVLIDQRGMGSSNPLDCEIPDDMAQDLPPDERDRVGRELLQSCLESLDADVTQYTQDIANQDIHDVLQALGYSQVNLYGVSWGTRSALLYAHRYPEQVRTVILDGMLPLDNPAPLYAAEDADRAMRLLIEDCAADPQCGRTYPDLENDLRRVMDYLGDKGQVISLPDPLTGEIDDFRLTRHNFGDLLRTALYSSELSRLAPLIVQRAAAGDYRPVIGLNGTVSSAADTMTIGATLTIFCSEEFARMDADALLQEAELDSLLGRQMILNFSNGCEAWPRAPLPRIYQEPVSIQAPTLILSGNLDPITPPRWGETMDEALPNSLHVIAPATGHNVGPVGCGSDLIGRFIEQGTVQDLDTDCFEELTRPSFFIDLSGPAPTGTEVSDND